MRAILRSERKKRSGGDSYELIAKADTIIPLSYFDCPDTQLLSLLLATVAFCSSLQLK